MAKRGRPRKNPLPEDKVINTGAAVPEKAKTASKTKQSAPKPKAKLRPQEESEIFALDIGTRK